MNIFKSNNFFKTSIVAFLIGAIFFGAGNNLFSLSEVMMNYQWNVLIIAIAMSVFTTLLAGTGFMSRMAVKFAELSKGKPLWIMTSYALLLFFFSAFLNNLTATLVVLPALFVLLRGVSINSAYIAGLFSLLLAVGNCAGASTPIGDFPAIIIMSSGITSFPGYLSHAFPLFITTAIVLVVAHILIAKRIIPTSEKITDKIERQLGITFLDTQHRHLRVNSTNITILGFIFICMFLGWATLSSEKFPPEIIAAAGVLAAAIFLTTRGEKTGIDSFDLKPFLMIGAFLFIAGIVNNTGMLTSLATFLEENIESPTILLFSVMLLTSFITGLISAGPAAAAMMPVIVTLANGPLQSQSDWLAIAFAASVCAGSSLFFWSASAGFLLADQVGKAELQDKRNNEHIKWGFKSYLKFGVLHYCIQLSIAICWVFSGITLTS